MSESHSRLCIKRLVIVESRSPVTYIRDIPLHAGLNVVWAEELPAAEGASEVARAGHGVGKSTFALMLRGVLGDDGAAVKTMRQHLARHYGTGGIAAEVLAGDQSFAVFCSFGSKSFAVQDATVEQLFEESVKPATLKFSSYVQLLGKQACLQYLGTSSLPVTGQTVEWEHVLCWIARDQSLGLSQYFDWRNDDGTGLRRRVKAPPALMRLILGLLSDAEAQAEESIARLNRELAQARDSLRGEEQRGNNTRSIAETQLRTWAGVSSSMKMVSDDLFEESVEREVKRKTQQIESKNAEDRATLAALDRELIDLAAEIKTQSRIVGLAKARWDEAVAQKNKDETALADARGRRDKLLTLSGMCPHGDVSYENCSYVQKQRETVSLSTQKTISALRTTAEEREEREAADQANYDREAKILATLTAAQIEKESVKARLNAEIEKRLRQLGESDSVRKTLTEWQENRKTPDTERLRASRSAVLKLEKQLESAKVLKLAAQTRVSDREREINSRFAELAGVFGAHGQYVPSDEKKPFHMLRAGGDAYTVLAILLGDLTCAIDGATNGGAHPGFLILDCPREREMSPQLYDRFLRLLDEVCRATPALQLIVTTTTPPPEPLRDPPTRILKLSHADDEQLLLKRRIDDLLTRVAGNV